MGWGGGDTHTLVLGHTHWGSEAHTLGSGTHNVFRATHAGLRITCTGVRHTHTLVSGHTLTGARDTLI